MNRRLATGLARCRICGEKIPENTRVIYACAGRSSGYCHEIAAQCNESWQDRYSTQTPD